MNRSQEREPATDTAEPTVQQSTESRSPSNTTQGSEREIDEVVKARRARQFEWQPPIDVDRSADLNEQAREVEAIGHLAQQLRAEGASEETITKEIAKQTEGRDVGLERNTQAQREHERHIDKVLTQQRQRLLDSEQPRATDREQDLDRSADERPAPTAEPTSDRDPYIEQAIREARERQEGPRARTPVRAPTGPRRAG